MIGELRHFSIGCLRFVRRPVAEVPVDGTLCFADNGHARGWTDRAPAMFKDGKWTSPNGKDLRFAPNYWIVLDEGAQHG